MDELDTTLVGRAPKAADLPKLTYAEQILKEALRLYPPVFCFGREIEKGFETAGRSLPARSQILIFPYVVHRNPHWFTSPECFQPERWTDEFIRQLPRYAYLPFGGGPRFCIGHSFAMAEVLIVMMTIAQHFRLKLAMPQIIKPTPGATLRPKNGVKMVVEKRLRP